ncbi:MAG: metal ABC transporter permease, partial [Treponema sp.]|nr:metal ABC transporter permease [Treponema sp.]
MFEMIAEIFSYTFMTRAIVVGLLVSLCAALLGVNLVLKRYAMIGTGLSHVGFAAMSIAGIVDFAPLAVSLVVVVAAAFLLLRLNENSKIRGDSAVALVSTSSLSIGVIVVALTTGLTLHVCNVMFGSIFIMTVADVYLSLILCALVLALFILFYKQLFAVTYDEEFARATGTRVELYKSLLAILT